MLPMLHWVYLLTAFLWNVFHMLNWISIIIRWNVLWPLQNHDIKIMYTIWTHGISCWKQFQKNDWWLLFSSEVVCLCIFGIWGTSEKCVAQEDSFPIPLDPKVTMIFSSPFKPTSTLAQMDSFPEALDPVMTTTRLPSQSNHMQPFQQKKSFA